MPRFARAILALLLLFPAFSAADEFQPLPTPCRVMDTRYWVEGVINQGEARPFSLSAAAAPGQGGAGGCSVPETASVVKLIVKGLPTVTDGGYFRVYNAGGDSGGAYTSINLQDSGQFVANTLDIPISQPAAVVGIFSNVEAHAVVEVVGWYQPGRTAIQTGVVVAKNLALPAAPGHPAYELELDTGVRVTCTLPYTEHTECDVAIGSTVWVSGHVENFSGTQYLYAHGPVGN